VLIAAELAQPLIAALVIGRLAVLAAAIVTVAHVVGS